jgi:hypothetical protein
VSLALHLKLHPVPLERDQHTQQPPCCTHVSHPP